jgi:hypothetical protein
MSKEELIAIVRRALTPFLGKRWVSGMLLEAHAAVRAALGRDREFLITRERGKLRVLVLKEQR